jgi:nitroreductase
MEFVELAQKRHSVRSYSDQPVDDAKLMVVLEAARLAPTACNYQPFSLIVIRDLAIRRQCATVYNRPWFLTAPVVIVACCDHSQSWHRADGKDYGEIDVAIVLDHITLAAADVGLGTCWIGNFSVSEAKKVLNIPAEISVVAMTPLGYPTSLPQVAFKSRKPLEQLVFWDHYGNTNKQS